ncbi:MAG: response regulator [Chloroflexi bacterium]|nr:MAG: response regulator [Chloroflexota bacterium]
MIAFYLTPTAISDLTLLIFAAYITGYLLYLVWRTRQKRPFQTITLTLAFISVSGYILLDFLNQTLYPDLAFWFLPLQSVVMTFGMVWLVQFAYRMPQLYPEWRRESRIVLGLMLLLPLWEVGYAIYRYNRLLEGYIIYRPSNTDIALVIISLWVVIVLLRQLRRADTQPLPIWRKFWRPQGRPARAARDFMLVFLLPVVLTAVLLMQGKTDLATTTANIFLSLGLLFAMLLFALVYLNYLPEQTTFMFRLSAITLAFFLGVLGTVGQAMTPSFVAAYDNPNLITAPQTLRFTPNAEDGYDIDSIPYDYSPFDDTQDKTFDNAQWGERLVYDEKQMRLPLDFEFPFFDQHWSELFVRWNGGVNFGQPPYMPDTLFRYGSAPSINLLAANLEAANLPPANQSQATSGVYAKTTPEQVTLTWFEMPEKNAFQNRYTFQLRLYADGSFEMTMVDLPALPQFDIHKRWHTVRLLGVWPGKTAVSSEHIRFNSDLPFRGGPEGVIEDYHLDFRTALHHFLTPLFWLTLFSVLLVSIGLPLAFRQNLVKPLHNLLAGVKLVNSGNLDTNIPVQVQDEFGYLTHTFNTMTAELNTLITDLEGRVSDRTAQLADTTAYLDNILRSATEYAIITIDHELCVTYFNPIAETLYGMPATDVLGKSLSTIPSLVTDSDRFRAGLNRVKTVGAHEYTRVQETPLGTQHIISRLSGIFDQQGALIGYAHFSQDISKRVHAEAQLLTQQRTLSALEERERIGRELHDSIGQVMGYLNLQMQAARALLADGRQEAVDKLLAQLTSVTQKSHNDVREFILGMKKPGSTPTDFWTALQLLAETFETEQQISVLLSLPSHEPSWLAAPNDLHLLRIIQEALANVRKHAAATQVQIIATQIAPDKAQFIISDNGRGFDPKNPQSSNPSISQSPSSPHFGLNIMRERAIELGGSLEIRSTPGQGTQVLITMAVQPETEETAPSQLTAPLRVLLVDDHPLFIEGLANILKIYGITVVGTASNGLEAQKLARQTHPDLIVMDIEMPICDGIEATQRIKAEFPDQRIIMLTVSATDDTLFAALKAGASGYLLKNMQAEELFMLIAGMGDGVPPIAPQLAGKVMAEFQRVTRPEVELNKRQWEILQLVANGRSYREVAAQLYVSERTIKRHMRQIMDILHLDSRAKAEAYARRHLQDKS